MNFIKETKRKYMEVNGKQTVIKFFSYKFSGKTENVLWKHWIIQRN